MNFTGAQRSWRTGPKRRLSPNPLFKKEKAAALRMIGIAAASQTRPRQEGKRRVKAQESLKGTANRQDDTLVAIVALLIRISAPEAKVEVDIFGR